jgi:hypothetical protein
MDYCRPEVTLVGSAGLVIESGLNKGPFQWESLLGPPSLTAVPAYEADE